MPPQQPAVRHHQRPPAAPCRPHPQWASRASQPRRRLTRPQHRALRAGATLSAPPRRWRLRCVPCRRRLTRRRAGRRAVAPRRAPARPHRETASQRPARTQPTGASSPASSGRPRLALRRPQSRRPARLQRLQWRHPQHLLPRQRPQQRPQRSLRPARRLHRCAPPRQPRRRAPRALGSAAPAGLGAARARARTPGPLCASRRPRPCPASPPTTARQRLVLVLPQRQ